MNATRIALERVARWFTLKGFPISVEDGPDVVERVGLDGWLEILSMRISNAARSMRAARLHQERKERR